MISTYMLLYKHHLGSALEDFPHNLLIGNDTRRKHVKYDVNTYKYDVKYVCHDLQLLESYEFVFMLLLDSSIQTLHLS